MNKIDNYTDCRYFCKEKNNCTILKKLYCKTEPEKPCAWYKKMIKEGKDNA